MTDIHVSVGPLLRGYRLKPVYDVESDILAVTSDFPGEWSLGVDIDGNIVFDLDASRTLVNFDVHIPKWLWARESLRSWPEGVASGCLVFSPETVVAKSFHLPLRLRYDETQRMLHLQIGAADESVADEVGEMIMLSPSCIAVLLRGRLIGFLIRTV